MVIEEVVGLLLRTLNVLRCRHGKGRDYLWQAQFGYGVDCRTEGEAQNLCRQQSVVTIENLLAKTAVEARGRSLVPTVGPGDGSLGETRSPLTTQRFAQNAT